MTSERVCISTVLSCGGVGGHYLERPVSATYEYFFFFLPPLQKKKKKKTATVSAVCVAPKGDITTDGVIENKKKKTKSASHYSSHYM